MPEHCWIWSEDAWSFPFLCMYLWMKVEAVDVYFTKWVIVMIKAANQAEYKLWIFIMGTNLITYYHVNAKIAIQTLLS